jgi:5'-nucleotidase
MKVLLTNDDGIKSAGIKALESVFSKYFDVYVVAPMKEVSGSSHSITFLTDIHIKIFDKHHIGVFGYPADCVNIALFSELIPEPDIIISGINAGPNMGEDVVFSGTVAAARHGFYYHKKSIAVSVSAFMDIKDIEGLAYLTYEVYDYLEELNLWSKAFFNVNYPNLRRNEIKGIRFTRLGKRIYRDKYILVDETNEYKTYRLTAPNPSSIDLPGSDFEAIRNGYVSITPLIIDVTAYDVLQVVNRQRRYLLDGIASNE